MVIPLTIDGVLEGLDVRRALGGEGEDLAALDAPIAFWGLDFPTELRSEVALPRGSLLGQAHGHTPS